MNTVSEDNGVDNDQDNLVKSSVIQRKEEYIDEKAWVTAGKPNGCKRFVTVEPAVIGSMFLITLYSIVSKEYFYQRIASDYNFTRNSTTKNSCGDIKVNESDPDYELHQKISAETASLSLYLGLASEYFLYCHVMTDPSDYFVPRFCCAELS